MNWLLWLSSHLVPPPQIEPEDAERIRETFGDTNLINFALLVLFLLGVTERIARYLAVILAFLGFDAERVLQWVDAYKEQPQVQKDRKATIEHKLDLIEAKLKEARGDS